MQIRIAVVASVVAIGSAVAEAQPPRRPDGPPHAGHSTPQARVVTRVNVNVDTDVDVSHGPARPADSDEGGNEENEVSRDSNAFGELVEAVLNRTGSGPAISVITDININVQTSVRVNKGPAPGHRPPHGIDDERRQQAAPRSPENRPAKKKKRPRKPNSEESEAKAPEPEDIRTTISLDRLKLGKDLEVGLSGEVRDEEQAREIARQINARTQQSLLGVAMIGMLVPNEQESLAVIRKGLGSVKADAQGAELSISAAIPRETPLAVKNVIQAAMKR
ncbi:hypothetical protein Pan44_41000 [Caulifigura coniformis]|uniref:Uncharacterized protein n=1 Tax=Caulifigura coniformis TaxID=2527983 RepID=A0A517SIV5_9PLAN|nr:hypothetical protein [Caulifigura coniformis]QDT56050.1 hypothetical protein Pan44_41000 [Caulifigura coniformis]